MKRDDASTNTLTAQNECLPVSTSMLITGMQESRNAIDRVFGSAQKIIRIFENDLSDSGYKHPGRIRLLERFLLKNRNNKLQIVLHDTRTLDRDCARLMALFRRHSDAFSIKRTTDAAKHASDSLIVADSNSAWHRLHRDHPQATYVIGESPDMLLLIQRFNEIWESSETAAGAFTLGL